MNRPSGRASASKTAPRYNRSQLERLTAEGITLIERRNCLELFRDQAIERFEAHTGSSWRPRIGIAWSTTARLPRP